MQPLQVKLNLNPDGWVPGVTKEKDWGVSGALAGITASYSAGDLSVHVKTSWSLCACRCCMDSMSTDAVTPSM
jgi:hypothetical protein